MNATNAGMLVPGNPQSAIRNPKCSAFTLVEALVAVGLTSILLWGLLQLFTSATRFTSTVTLEAELCSAGRAVLERMIRELSSAASQHNAYMKITGDRINEKVFFDTIQFVAPVGDGTDSLAHVKYSTQVVDSSHVLCRAENTSDSLDDHHATDSAVGTPLGLPVESFRITYSYVNSELGSDGAVVDSKCVYNVHPWDSRVIRSPDYTEEDFCIPSNPARPLVLDQKLFDHKFKPHHALDPGKDYRYVPVMISVEIRISDRKGKATIALCSSAFLPGSGL